MQITHIAGLNLAVNGWEIVADPMLAGNSNDNWQQTDAGLLADYPRPFQLTLRNRAVTRTTLYERVSVLLSILDAARDYTLTPSLTQRLTVALPPQTYYVPFQLERVTATLLQHTGSQFVQSVVLQGVLLSPPYRNTQHQHIISNILSYNLYTISFPTPTIWSPSSITMQGQIWQFGGMWVGETSRNGPANPIVLINPALVTPTQPLYPHGTAMRANLAAGTYTIQFAQQSPNEPTDVWVHVTSGYSCTVQLHIVNQLIAQFKTHPHQVCYYAGRIPPNLTISMTITCNGPTDVFPLVCAHPTRTRAIVATYPHYVSAVEWHNSLISSTATHMRDHWPLGVAGAVDCLTPQQFQFVVTYFRFFTTPNVIMTHYPFALGLL